MQYLSCNTLISLKEHIHSCSVGKKKSFLVPQTFNFSFFFAINSKKPKLWHKFWFRPAKIHFFLLKPNLFLLIFQKIVYLRGKIKISNMILCWLCCNLRFYWFGITRLFPDRKKNSLIKAHFRIYQPLFSFKNLNFSISHAGFIFLLLILQFAYFERSQVCRATAGCLYQKFPLWKLVSDGGLE